MKLRQLSLTNFKNIPEARLEFSGKVNCFLGNNGMGKSNMLDAIYFLSFCKSFSRVPDRMLIRRGEDFAIAKANYERKGIDEELTLGLSSSRRKSLKRGGKEYDRLSTHIGSFPLVMIAPQDIDLIRESGEERRHWLDLVISQSDAVYLENLIRFNRGLEQRNRMLREGVVDANLYAAVEIQMDMTASYIHAVRAQKISELTEIFDRYYKSIAGDEGESVSLSYESALNRPGSGMQQLLDEARRHDEIVKHTSVGIHRDDIGMTLDSMPLRRIGSQGQCKTFTIALRLAQFEFLRRATGITPLLLLDDIFDKLDASRVERIMNLVTSDSFGQIFITDTNRTHLDEIMRRTGGDYKMWTVDHGVFTPSAE